MRVIADVHVERAFQMLCDRYNPIEKVAKHVTYTTHAVVCSRIPAVHTYAANNAVKHAIRTFHASRLDTGASNAV